MSEHVYVYKLEVEDLPWVKEAVLVSSNGDLFEYTWAEGYVVSGNMFIALHESGFIEATSRPYWEDAICLDTADEFKEKIYERLLTT